MIFINKLKQYFFKKKIIFWEGYPGLTNFFPPYFLKNGKTVIERILQNYFDPHAVILPMWYDVYFDIINKKIYYGNKVCYDISTNKTYNNNEVFTQEFNVTQHGNTQLIDHLPSDCLNKNSIIIKINSPWFFKTLPGYNILQLPINFNHKHFEIVPGVTWQDVYFDTNAQFLVKSNENFSITAGSPICLLIPYKREKFKIKKLKCG